jgi:subtilisin family serine protease
MIFSSRCTVSTSSSTVSTIFKFILVGSLIGTLAAVSGCRGKADSKKSNDVTAPSLSTLPEVNPETGKTRDGTVTLSSGKLPVIGLGGDAITLPGGSVIHLETISGQVYIPVQAALDEASFRSVLATARSLSATEAERLGRLSADLDATIKIIGETAHFIRVKTHPRYGFFSALMPLAAYESLTTLSGLPHTVVMNPAVHVSLGAPDLRMMDKKILAGLDARATTEAFSGLRRMGVPEFLEQLPADLGDISDIDGRRVLIGVTDTGVTYNHPTFTDETGASRIVRMRDFTGEGRIFFNPTAQFDVSVSDASDLPDGTDAATALTLTAQVYAPIKGNTGLPVADVFKEVKGILLVTPELKTILTTPGSGAKLGIFAEESFQSSSEAVDINQNGKVDDNLPVLLVPGETAGTYKLYFSPVGELDFRAASVVGDWNTTKETIKLNAEAFGFEIALNTLIDSHDHEVAVMSASIVGFDPGNHGSHVSGIIAGRRTITNDTAASFARGAAPNAKLMLNRVCANNGGCEYTDAVIDLAENGAEVVNLSIGGLSPYNDGYAVDEILMDRLTEMHNTLFVISAGNSGPGINTVGSPSTSRHAISVAATASRHLIERQYQYPGKGKSALVGNTADDVEDNDFLLFFSSRGPSAAGGFKPDIAAPGTELSSIQLNSAPGAGAGLAVYWGTSMAAPSATGAISLLIDAAKRYNELHPDQKLPLDALTLRRVVVNSARPFDVTRFDPKTGEFSRGQYTWIDQGLGMINLSRAWAALKAERDSHLSSAVYAVKDGVRTDIGLDYQVRVLRSSPNGINYDGSIAISEATMKVTGPRFGRGIWLDYKGSDSLIPVQIARRLPTTASDREDVGDLRRQLLTTQDTFALKTVIFGSNVVWAKAGTLEQLDCTTSPRSSLTVLGQGAVDNFGSKVEDQPRSIADKSSILYVCIDRVALSALPAGDHGALIFAYKTSADQVETTPSFIVPVYITVPQKTLAGAAAFEATGAVKSFGVDRHYVDVPRDISLVTVSIEVPAAQVNGCMGVRLYVYEAGNTLTPKELATKADSIAHNCNTVGEASAEKQVVTYTRNNPKSGLWNVLVFGYYQYPLSDYKVTVEYAKVKIEPAEIVGAPAALDGKLLFEVLESSFASAPDSARSSFALEGFSQVASVSIAEDAEIKVPTPAGKTARTYGPEVTTVNFSTGGSTGNDIDLYALDCKDEELTDCDVAGESTSSTDVEAVTFTPEVGHFYAARVLGYTVSQNDGKFSFKELQSLKAPETGTLTVATVGDGVYEVAHAFAADESQLLVNPLFTSGHYLLSGSLVLRSAGGALMTRIPVTITSLAQ